MSGRLIDIPYNASTPIVFVYQQVAPLQGGVYTFAAGQKATLTPSRPILPRLLYYFQTLDFAVDVNPFDYMSAYTSLPYFSLYVLSEAGAPALREPIPLPKFYEDFTYPLFALGGALVQEAAYPGAVAVAGQTFPQKTNILLAGISGTVAQTPAMLGKNSLTATVVLSCLEIDNRPFIEDFVKNAASGSGLNASGKNVWLG